MARAPLQDGHGRKIADLRLSVTDRCNFRCQYCMPAEGLPWLERAEGLSFEEIERLVRPLVPMGWRGGGGGGGGWRPCRSPPTATCSIAMPRRGGAPASTASTCRSTRSSATA